MEQSHPSANDQNAGTVDRPWKTITKANQTLSAGDTVYIKAGSYSSYIAPSKSGTYSNRITYMNYRTDTVVVENAAYGIRLSAKSYITVQGINFYNLDRFMHLENSSNYNIIAYCNFDQMRTFADWAGSRIWTGSSYNWVHHCRFSNYGECSAGGSDSGTVLEIGYDDGDTAYCGNYNLIENNTMFNGGHHVLGVHGTRNIIWNNYLHNYAWSRGKGNRTLILGGYASSSNRNLIEGNRFGYSYVPCDQWGAPGAQVGTSYNIIRRNAFFFNNLAGLQLSMTDSYWSGANYNRIYNNTFNSNGWQLDDNGLDDQQRGQITFNDWSTKYTIKYNAIKNNLYYRAPRVYGYTGAVSGDQTFAGNYNGDVSGDPKFVNATSTPGDPADSGYPNLHLEGSSPCIDKGVALTTISSASGTGTSLVVADAGYFMDGWGITGVEGDEIQLFGSTQKARIVSVDYSTNTITLGSKITWTQNQGVSLAYEGAGPDIGAYELSQAHPPEAPMKLRLTE